MRRWLILLFIAAPALLRGQTPISEQKPLAFEVASVKVKPNTSGESGFGISGPMPSQFTTKNAPLDPS